MKKLICLLLAFLLAFGLCACSDSKDNDKDDDKEEDAEEIVIDNEDDDDEDDDWDDMVEDTDDTYTDDEVNGNFGDGNTSSNTGSARFSIGTVKRGTYKNDFAGITFTPPTSWTFYDEAQIMQLNNIASDYMSDDVVELLESANIVYDMYAINQSTGDNVNINYEKVGAAKFERYTLAEIIESQICILESSYAQMGFKNVEITQSVKRVDGKKMEAVNIYGEYQGVAMYGVAMSFRQGDYIATVTVCSVGGDRVDEFLEYFEFE